MISANIPTYDAQIGVQLKLFPNPFSTQATLLTEGVLTNATLVVENCIGQAVRQINNINGTTITFNREDLPSGIYFIRLTQEEQLIGTEKLIITD